MESNSVCLTTSYQTGNTDKNYKMPSIVSKLFGLNTYQKPKNYKNISQMFIKK